jgi:integrase
MQSLTVRQNPLSSVLKLWVELSARKDRGMRSAKRLTPEDVGGLSKPGRFAVGDGAYIQISKNGTRSWLFRYQHNGKSRAMGLGPYGLLTVGEARKKARQARKLLLDGIDPLDAKAGKRRQAALDAAKAVTFKDCAERYIQSHAAGWRNPKHKAQWSATLETYAYPVFGDLAVGDLDTGLVLKALEPIWATKPETASRVRGRIEVILSWAKVRGYREGENPARWRGHLDQTLPARSKVRKVQHHAALPYAELPAFMGELRKREGVAARALEFAIMTAARTGEVIGATWGEIDLEAKLWMVPAERMKGKRSHRVPLCERALEILSEMPRVEGSNFVFPGSSEKRPLSNMALLMMLRRMNRDDITAHGFRSTFRDWAAETTTYPNELVEMALAHVVSSKTEAAYRRGDLFEKRWRLMDDWAAYCMSPPRDSSVVPLRRAP